jgi:hypothetical protein
VIGRKKKHNHGINASNDFQWKRKRENCDGVEEKKEKKFSQIVIRFICVENDRSSTSTKLTVQPNKTTK